jgi:oligopeptide/dipeptide ABC transporter ATP-binding protein
LAILEVKNLKVNFRGEAGINHAVDGVSFSVNEGRILGIVGESGCGKSVSAMSILRLVPDPPGNIAEGEILWKGKDLLSLPLDQMPDIRGREIAMIFQDPMASLNPVFTIRRLMGEVIKKRFNLKGPQVDQRAIKAMTEVGISDPESRLSAYPHELSGGMKQRILIAMALLCEPQLLIADEPTTALDVTIQKQILFLMKDLQNRTGMSIILITHDIGVVAETCDDVVVMYAGRVVETCSIHDLFQRNRHPYTRGLLNSIPRKGLSKEIPLPTIEGTVPSLVNPPKGCRFADRCSFKQDQCLSDDPLLRELSPRHHAACHFPLGEAKP